MQPTKSNSRLRLNAGAGGDYVKLSSERTETDGFVNEQWIEPEKSEPIPWKTIMIILALFAVGVISLSWAFLEWKADLKKEHEDRTSALAIIGVLTLIPGGYYLYVLFCVSLGRRSMDDIRRLS